MTRRILWTGCLWLSVACGRQAAEPRESAAERPAAGDTPAVAAPADAAPARQLLAEGAMAPDFTAVDHMGRTIRLSDLRGKPVVLYWYPKDDTPG